jgi:threonine dehydrogenase-like Zn-dependent dehydrogenase
MRAVTWHGKRDVRLDMVPDPAIQELPFDQAPQACESFQKKEDGMVKVLPKP